MPEVPPEFGIRNLVVKYQIQHIVHTVLVTEKHISIRK